jgi:hypothetical protein
MSPETELETRLRALREQESPRMDTSAAIDLILARRARGERVALPVEARRRVGQRHWIILTAAAAALLLVLVPVARDRTPPAPAMPDTASTSSSASLLPAPLFAQTTRSPIYPVLDEPLGLRLKPGRWYYHFILGEGVPGPRDTLIVAVIEQTTYQGQPAWRFLGGRRFSSGPLFTRDTIWTTRDSLRILGRVAQIGPDARIEETYDDSSVLRGETHGGFTAWQRRPIHQPEGPDGNGVPIRWYQFAAALQTARLSADWKASVEFRGLIFDGERSRDYLNIAVLGEETITVPAGRFDCWKVGIGGEHLDADDGIFFWISKDRGWIVAQRVANRRMAQMNMLLARYEEVR